MVQQLTAVQFIRFMANGRTSPVLFGCEDESGKAAGEYVLKLRGFLQPTGSIRELLGNRVASHFDLPVPEPALILLEQDLADLVAESEPSKAVIIKGSVGLNFGTQVAIGFNTWPVDKSIQAAIWQTAANIFAFDALIQNPDRTYNNPNLLTRGDSILILDHEIAFSFLLEILPSLTPWRLDHQQHLINHVFYRRLKSKTIDLTDFEANLANLSDSILKEIFADVPLGWNNEHGPRIVQHLCAVRDHAEEFAEEVRRFLA